MKKIAISNQKGGVGKTTTTINLAASLGMLGKRVLMIDMDPQGNTTTGLGVNKGAIDTCVYDVLLGKQSLEDVIYPTEFKNISLVPAKIHLSGIDIELAQLPGRELIMKKEVLKIEHNYDYIIFDCPPSLGLLTLNALAAAKTVMVPIQAEYYALEGVSQLLNTIRLAQRHLNRNLKIEGIIMTMTVNTNLSHEVEEEVRSLFKDKVYRTTISRGVRLSEAPSHGLPISYYDPKSKGAEEYMSLAKEVIASE
ncbi:sporulation initiation inhibitor Soj [Erysipelotrichaceae bacterium]|nr:sporulation initiation inhibitor Soj [Erysipelotrichaceae bacterium]